MVGIIVPAYEEEERIEGCIQSLLKAAGHPALVGEAVQVIVVLDACEDRTGPLARSLGAHTIELRARNVGLWPARQAHESPSPRVPGWLAAQLALGADAVCGLGAPGLGSQGLALRQIRPHCSQRISLLFKAGGGGGNRRDGAS